MESKPSTSTHAPKQPPSHQVKYYQTYFSPGEVEYLSEKQRGKSTASEEKLRQQACNFIEVVCVKIGFPRKTIATAQCLYHRFHLFFPRKDFNYIDVCLACTYVSTKMHDTLKKPRDILMVAYAVRFPELAARSKAIGGDVEMDPHTVEADRQRILGIERLVLETVCFNFTVRMPFPYVIKLGRTFDAPKRLTRLAWRLCADSFRTYAPLLYPPHVIAAGCLYLGALLCTFEQPNDNQSEDYLIIAAIAKEFEGYQPWWTDKFHICLEDVEEICHYLLDLLLYAAQNTSATTSPSTPTSPSPHAYPSPRSHSSSQLLPSHLQHQPAPPLPLPYKYDMLMHLKIHLREIEHQPLPRGQEDKVMREADNAGIGKNEGTVRFMFGPERLVGNAI
ncbi:cyclin-like protein [Schizopora paradoxa]|uniref:Cyclin-like protein n=1 Tax=Schizopora paradoxa TaxID=27342 RepID=A0A0H2RQC1_9AGAM|nr:cyclin-like protein [Schizopora paradoxa]